MSEPKEHTNYLGEPLLNNTIWKDAKKGFQLPLILKTDGSKDCS